MKVAVVSHSYLEPENQKNIFALNSYCKVKCLLPHKGSVLVFKDYEFKNDRDTQEIFNTYNTFHLTKAQFIFRTLTMNFMKINPDIVNVEYNPWSLIFMQVLLAKKIFSKKVKIICTIKKNTYKCYPSISGWLKKKVTKFGLDNVDHIIASSKMTESLLINTLSVPKKKITVCHHLGVDTKLFSPLPAENQSNDNVVIGYTGRFDTAKGLTDLIEAIKIIRISSDKNIKLKLLGGSAYHELLDLKSIKETENTDWLEILPPVSNSEVASFLQHIDIYVLPSRNLYDHQEHDAHALLEALAVGVPCIGTKSGIIPEILGDGTGCLVSPESPVELANVLSRLIDNLHERVKMSMLGREKSTQEFSLDVIAKKKFKIYSEVLNEK